ncbi:MAG: DUF4424 family protein [Alphaproteobacteria bacterium]|nr:DUF4424 family protein [Alphaproteobacteria bacterium]MBV9372145.1 DUF4424 family protein [Alphaproteobacteria bacterium]MBV9901897.1 DUF4424 family protein [Alphaproteobacteria bacterium]
MNRALALLLVALAAPAAANDSVAGHSAGGLVLARSADIDMLSEDLFVSAAEVRVRYVFRNRSGREVRTTVAFPMPDRDRTEEHFSDVAYPERFRTLVDGRPVAMAVERRAFLKGVDRTALLGELGLSPDAEGKALDALPAAARARLLKLGLAAVDEYDDGHGWERHLVPAWTERETWHWEQAFPAGRDLVVEHRYVPGTGGSVGSGLALREFRASSEGRRTIERYCADGAFLAGLDRLARRAGGIVPEQRIGYVLTTGANWRAPIGRFRLVVDKGAPDNLVSFCAEGVRKISPTRFELVRTNWRPDRDLDVMIVLPAPR